MRGFTNLRIDDGQAPSSVFVFNCVLRSTYGSYIIDVFRGFYSPSRTRSETDCTSHRQ